MRCVAWLPAFASRSSPTPIPGTAICITSSVRSRPSRPRGRAGFYWRTIAFIEAPESRAELEEIARRVKHPLFVNMLTGGVTPILPVKELEQLGYKLVGCPIDSLM